jgi:hypothetical protein
MKLNFSLLIILTLFVSITNAAPPILDKVLIADVTDRSFSVIFTSNEMGTPKLEVYSDITGLNQLLNNSVISYPVGTGNIFSGIQNGAAAKKIIIDAAKILGIIKLSVSGLMPDTQYYVKYGFDNTTAESTLCPDAGITLCPDLSGSLVSIKTARQQTRNQSVAGLENLFTNDVLMLTDQNLIVGELVIMATENTRYPVSVFAGDGMPLPYVLIDMNNYTTYDQQGTYIIRGDDQQLKGNHGEAVLVRQYRGQNGDTSQVSMVGKVNVNGGLIKSISRKMADCNADGNVNGYDSLLLQHVIATNVLTTDYTNVAFHPLLCNLYMEEGLNSVTTAVNIDSADFSRMSDALVGKILLENLPETP